MVLLTGRNVLVFLILYLINTGLVLSDVELRLSWRLILVTRRPILTISLHGSVARAL